MHTKYGFIGFGNLSKAIVKGFSGEKDLAFAYYSKTNRHKEIEAKTSLIELILWADVIVLGLKPMQVEELLSSVDKELFCGKILLSPVAGLKVSRLEKYLGKDKSILRIMPNMAVAFGQAVIAFHSNSKSKSINQVKKHLEQLGKLVEIEESEFDLFTAIFGSGPAFFLELLLATKEKIKELKSISEPEADSLLVELMKGTTSYLESNNTQDLIAGIASKGGTTEAGLTFMREHKLGNLFKEVFFQAEKRSAELS